MLNPERKVFGSQPISVPETPKKNGHLPRWARIPAFALRASLAILTATPGMTLVANTINRMENSSIIYTSDQKVAVNSRYDFDQTQLATPTPTPTETPQAPITYNVKLCMDYQDRSCTGSFSHLTQCFASEQNRSPNAPLCTGSDREYIYGGRTGITLKTGQELEISASGRIHLSSGVSMYRSTGCKDWDEVDPDGNRYLKNTDTKCSSNSPIFDSGEILRKAPRGSLIGSINKGVFREDKPELFLVGSYWKGSADRDGLLALEINYDRGGDKGGFDITVKVYPITIKDANAAKIASLEKARSAAEATVTANAIRLEALGREQAAIKATATLDAAKLETVNKEMAAIGVTATAVAMQSSAPTPRSAAPEIKSTQAVPIVSSNPTEVSIWLRGLGVVLSAISLAGLAAYWGYERGKLKTPPPPPPSAPSPGRGGFNLNTGPNTAPNFGPTQPKNPEWAIGQQEFAKRWQDAKSKLSPLRPGDSGNEHGYILERFKAGMGIVHEVSLDGAIKIPAMATRIRAGMEYLMPEIWPNNMIFKRFFDPKFNAGFLTPEDLAKIFYLPEKYRSLSSFTNDQRRDIRRIRRVLMFALHPDNSQADSDKSLQDSIDELLKKLNPAWSYVDKLIK